MAGSDEQRGSDGAFRDDPPGPLSRLLEELARGPGDDPLGVWQDGLKPGDRLDRFEIRREIGRGGFGAVYEAFDNELGRVVAIKRLRPGRSRGKQSAGWIKKEAEAVAKLSHPGIVTLHDVCHCASGPYLVMERLEGKTLAQRLAVGRLPRDEALRVAEDMAQALAHAHKRGILHRDLKPANVFLCDDGRVKLLDFGLAHLLGTQESSGAGTPAYMAPEQASGGHVDERADVYAAGMVLGEMLTGKRPHEAIGSMAESSASSVSTAAASSSSAQTDMMWPDVAEVAATALQATASSEAAVAPAVHLEGVPRPLARIVSSALSPDPSARPRDGGAWLDALRSVRRALERPQAFRRVALLASIFLLLGLVIAGLAARRVWRSQLLAGEDGRISVAVADFANQTGDADFDGLSGLLITSLEQSRKLRVLTRGRMIDLVREMGTGDASRIDESVARTVGRKAGVRALLLASIQKLGDTYAVELRALDPKRDEYLFAIRDQATAKHQLLPLIDRISDRARLALQESDADRRASEVNVAEAVTGNLEAYRHYFRGKDLAASGRLSEAVDEYRRAVEIEPRFALARVEIAWIGFFSSDVSRAAARDIIREAERNAAHAPEKESGLIRILSAFFDGRFAASRAEIRSLAARYPDDRDIAVIAAEVLAWCGDVEGAIPYFERALQLAPDWDSLRFDQVAVLNFAGRGQEALDLAEVGARQRATPAAKAVVGVARYMVGDVEGGIDALRASGADDSLARSFLAQGLAAKGKVADALASLGASTDVTSETTRAQVLAYAGRLRDGLAAMEAAAHRPGVDVAFNRQQTAWYAAAAGDLEKARELVSKGDFFMFIDGVMLSTIGDERRLGELLAQMGPDPLLYGRFLRALSAHRAGDFQTALAELRSLDNGTVSFVPYFHGLVAAESGHDREAVEALSRFGRPAYWASDAFEAPWFVARARFLLARSLDRLGWWEEARTVLDLQLERWKDADATLPLLAEMNELRAKLGTADVK